MSRLLIALCGAPGAGKTTVQNILRDEYGVVPVDDGYPMRHIAVTHFGLGWDDVNTVAGKARVREIAGGRKVEVRQLLGQIGNAIEAIGGDEAIPEMAIFRSALIQAPGLSFGSVRRDQGLVYKRHGGIVVEVCRPGHIVKNEFDSYLTDIVDFTITNDRDIETLKQRVRVTLGPRLEQEFIA